MDEFYMLAAHHPARSAGSDLSSLTFIRRAAPVLVGAIVLLCPFELCAGTAPRSISRNSRIANNYGRVPLSFESNQGQAPPDVKFLSHGAAYSILLEDRDAVFVLSKASKAPAAQKPEIAPQPLRAQNQSAATSILRMSLLNAETVSAPVGEEILPGTVNYITGSNPAQWRTGLPTFQRVRYASVYPGVDLIYYGIQSHLEFDFNVVAGGNPDSIQMRFEGSSGLKIDRDGNLIVPSPSGDITFRKPSIYQEAGYKTRSPIEGSFHLLAQDTVGFSIGAYDHSRTLTIDPILSYSEFFGFGTPAGIAVNSQGEVYLTGFAFFPDVPATPGSFEAVPATKDQPNISIFVSKFTSDGSALIYSTYISGHGNDEPDAIAIDSEGNAYVAGGTTSIDFPITPGAFQAAQRKPNIGSGFILKLNSTGTKLIYSTLLGGSQSSGVESMVIDQDGNAYVTGGTQAPDFPTTPHAFQRINKAAGKPLGTVFLSKMNATGTQLIYSTFIGGSIGSGPTGIALDPEECAYISGWTYDRDFPVTPGAFRTDYTNEYFGGFVAKMNPQGTKLEYGTYIGGDSHDIVNAIAVDPSGDAYVTGATTSFDFPVTSGAFQTTLPSPYGSGFVTKFNQAGTGIIYSTFFGGKHPPTGGFTIAIDSLGNAFVAAITGSVDFPVTPGAFEQVNRAVLYSPGDPDYSSAVVKLAPNGSRLLYSTYLSGDGDELGDLCDCAKAAALDPSGNFYVTGIAVSPAFPTTAGAYSSEFVPGIFLTKFTGSEMTELPISTTTVTADSNPSKANKPVTFTIRVKPGRGGATPTGTVGVSTDENPWTVVPLDKDGVATYTSTAFWMAGNAFSAIYLGDEHNSPSSHRMTETIDHTSGGLPTVTTVKVSANPVNWGTPVTFKVSVRDPSGKGIPAGWAQIQIIDQPASEAFLDPKGNATITFDTLPPGATDLVVGYGPMNGGYAASRTTITENVIPRGKVPAPVLSLKPGTYRLSQKPYLTLTVPGHPEALILYTNNGYTPVRYECYEYNAPIPVTESQTIKVIAIENGYVDSAERTATYTIVPGP